MALERPVTERSEKTRDNLDALPRRFSSDTRPICASCRCHGASWRTDCRLPAWLAARGEQTSRKQFLTVNGIAFTGQLLESPVYGKIQSSDLIG